MRWTGQNGPTERIARLELPVDRLFLFLLSSSFCLLVVALTLLIGMI